MAAMKPSQVHGMLAEMTDEDIDNVLAARSTDEFVEFARAVARGWRRKLSMDRLDATAAALRELVLPTIQPRREE